MAGSIKRVEMIILSTDELYTEIDTESRPAKIRL